MDAAPGRYLVTSGDKVIAEGEVRWHNRSLVFDPPVYAEGPCKVEYNPLPVANTLERGVTFETPGSTP